MKRFIIPSIIVLCNVFLAKSQELTKANILKDGTVLTYSVNELTKQIGFSGVRIVEGKPTGDEVKVAFVQTDKGLQPMQVDADGKEVFSDAIHLNNNSKITTYKSYIDIFFSRKDAMSVLLNDTMFMKQSIEIYPEWEKDSYPYNKEKTNVSFSFQLNGKEQKATVNYYRTNKVDETMATTFAFLNNKELPIQTHLYYEYNLKDMYGMCLKLVSIETKE